MLLYRLKELNFEFSIECLDVGDIEVRDNDNKVVYSIERKTVEDWQASICDGRYKEQKHRLLAAPYRIAYILEGNIDKKRKRIHDNAMRGSLMNTSIRDNVCIIRTTGLDDTAKLVTELERRLSRTKVTTGLQIPVFKASKRARMNSPRTVLVRQLMCIPGISETMARAIIEQYRTRESIRRAAREEDGLSNLKVGKRKLGNTAVKNIQRHF